MKVKYIVLSGKKYPAICTLNVLAEIQEHYSTTMEFEREILGLYYLRNENGEYILDDNGNPKMGMKEPSAKAVKGINIRTKKIRDNIFFIYKLSK